MKNTRLNHWSRLFDHFESIEIKKQINADGEIEHTIVLKLENYSHNQKCKNAQLTFFGVRALKLGDIDWPAALLVNVTDISQDQMEGIRYSVREDENDLFSFYCKSFSFQEIS